MGQQDSAVKTVQPPGHMPAGFPGTGTWITPVGEGDRVELLDEGDGRILVRTAFNRDRVLRLTMAQFQQLVALYFGAATETAPERVTS